MEKPKTKKAEDFGGKIQPGQIIKSNTVSYKAGETIGHGSFGIVFQATQVDTGEVFAIKKVLQDRRFKNRELAIMQMLSHPNVVSLKNSFYSTSPEKPDEVYLNLVLDYVPDTVYGVVRSFAKAKKPVPIIYVKLFTYQLCRALSYIHGTGICHRDIKPQNLLVDTNLGILKLCDFGSAKSLNRGENSVSYICSRYYRAPELIFGATNYTTSIDIWSMGCVLAELLLEQPLFPGESGVDQLVEIIKVLGTPTKTQIKAMNDSYTDFNFPQIKPQPWDKVFKKGTPSEAIDLVKRFLQYDPTKRVLPLEACTHPFFDELRTQGTKLPNGKKLPSSLFLFSSQEIQNNRSLYSKLVPEWARNSTLGNSGSNNNSSSNNSNPAVNNNNNNGLGGGAAPGGNGLGNGSNGGGGGADMDIDRKKF